MRPRLQHAAASINHRSLVVAMLLSILMQSSCLSDPASGTADPGIPTAEFSIDKDGRLIVLPVDLNDQKIECLIDTGASACCFDISLKGHLGRSRGKRVVQTPAGHEKLETFDWPDASLSGHAFASGLPVVCVDLESIRQASGKDVRAIIGMDVLRSCRLQIDFDRGRLCFLDSLPEDRSKLGSKTALTLRHDGTPWIDASIKETEMHRFLIDTGAQGNSLGASLFDEYAEEGVIALGTPSASVTIAGRIQGEAGRIRSLTVGPFTKKGLRVARSDANSVGLRYLSRFCVTFDFPGRAAYWRKGAGYLKPEPQATSGMVLAWVNGDVVVKSVLEKGPAAAADLRRNDVLVRVEGTSIAEFDHFSLRALLTSEVGRRVPLTVRRGEEELDAEVILIEK